VTLRVPAGMQSGERLRLARQHRPRDGEVATDLFVTVAIRPHPLFSLDGKDLLCTVPVNIFRLLHGGPLDIPMLNGMQQIALEPYPRHGLEYKLPGFGYPGRHGRGVGHLLLKLQPVFPEHLTDAELKLLLRLEKLMLENAHTQAPELAAWEQKLAQARSRTSG
jgi:DnaJ-class molecular chaperone